MGYLVPLNKCTEGWGQITEPLKPNEGAGEVLTRAVKAIVLFVATIFALIIAFVGMLLNSLCGCGTKKRVMPAIPDWLKPRALLVKFDQISSQFAKNDPTDFLAEYDITEKCFVGNDANGDFYIPENETERKPLPSHIRPLGAAPSSRIDMKWLSESNRRISVVEVKEFVDPFGARTSITYYAPRLDIVLTTKEGKTYYRGPKMKQFAELTGDVEFPTGGSIKNGFIEGENLFTYAPVA